MEVIGDTVVATRIESPSDSEAESSEPPHPASTRAAAETLARTSGNGRIRKFYGERSVIAKDLHLATAGQHRSRGACRPRDC